MRKPQPQLSTYHRDRSVFTRQIADAELTEKEIIAGSRIIPGESSAGEIIIPELDIHIPSPTAGDYYGMIFRSGLTYFLRRNSRSNYTLVPYDLTQDIPISHDGGDLGLTFVSNINLDQYPINAITYNDDSDAFIVSGNRTTDIGRNIQQYNIFYDALMGRTSAGISVFDAISTRIGARTYSAVTNNPDIAYYDNYIFGTFGYINITNVSNLKTTPVAPTNYSTQVGAGAYFAATDGKYLWRLNPTHQTGTYVLVRYELSQLLNTHLASYNTKRVNNTSYTPSQYAILGGYYHDNHLWMLIRYRNPTSYVVKKIAVSSGRPVDLPSTITPPTPVTQTITWGHSANWNSADQRYELTYDLNPAATSNRSQIIPISASAALSSTGATRKINIAPSNISSAFTSIVWSSDVLTITPSPSAATGNYDFVVTATATAISTPPVQQVTATRNVRVVLINTSSSSQTAALPPTVSPLTQTATAYAGDTTAKEIASFHVSVPGVTNPRIVASLATSSSLWSVDATATNGVIKLYQTWTSDPSITSANVVVNFKHEETGKTDSTSVAAQVAVTINSGTSTPQTNYFAPRINPDWTVPLSKNVVTGTTETEDANGAFTTAPGRSITSYQIRAKTGSTNLVSVTRPAGTRFSMQFLRAGTATIQLRGFDGKEWSPWQEITRTIAAAHATTTDTGWWIKKSGQTNAVPLAKLSKNIAEGSARQQIFTSDEIYFAFANADNRTIDGGNADILSYQGNTGALVVSTDGKHNFQTASGQMRGIRFNFYAVGTNIDYESQQQARFRVSAAIAQTTIDGTTYPYFSDEFYITYAITNVNEAPTWITGYTFQGLSADGKLHLPANTGPHRYSMNGTVTDDNSEAQLTLNIATSSGSNITATWERSTNDLLLTAGAQQTAETTLTLTWSDGTNTSTAETVTIVIDAPTKITPVAAITSDQITLSVEENTGEQAATYGSRSLASSDSNTLFGFTVNSLVVKDSTLYALNYRNTTIRAADIGTDGSLTRNATKDFTVTGLTANRRGVFWYTIQYFNNAWFFGTPFGVYYTTSTAASRLGSLGGDTRALTGNGNTILIWGNSTYSIYTMSGTTTFTPTLLHSGSVFSFTFQTTTVYTDGSIFYASGQDFNPDGFVHAYSWDSVITSPYTPTRQTENDLPGTSQKGQIAADSRYFFYRETLNRVQVIYKQPKLSTSPYPLPQVAVFAANISSSNLQAVFGAATFSITGDADDNLRLTVDDPPGDSNTATKIQTDYTGKVYLKTPYPDFETYTPNPKTGSLRMVTAGSPNTNSVTATQPLSLAVTDMVELVRRNSVKAPDHTFNIDLAAARGGTSPTWDVDPSLYFQNDDPDASRPVTYTHNWVADPTIPGDAGIFTIQDVVVNGKNLIRFTPRENYVNGSPQSRKYQIHANQQGGVQSTPAEGTITINPYAPEGLRSHYPSPVIILHEYINSDETYTDLEILLNITNPDNRPLRFGFDTDFSQTSSDWLAQYTFVTDSGGRTIARATRQSSYTAATDSAATEVIVYVGTTDPASASVVPIYYSLTVSRPSS